LREGGGARVGCEGGGARVAARMRHRDAARLRELRDQIALQRGDAAEI